MLVRLSVPVPAKIVPEPRVVMPPSIVRVWPADTFRVPASLTKVRPVLLIDSGLMTSIVPEPMLVTCALKTFTPALIPPLRSVPLFVSVPAARVSVAAVGPQQLPLLLSRAIRPLLVNPVATFRLATVFPAVSLTKIDPVAEFTRPPLTKLVLPVGSVMVPLLTRSTLAAMVSLYSASEAPAATVRVLPATAALIVAAPLPPRSRVTEPAGSVRLLAKFRVGVLVRLSVPVLAKIVPEPKEVMPPSIVSF